jgi:hypothetical protein
MTAARTTATMTPMPVVTTTVAGTEPETAVAIVTAAMTAAAELTTAAVRAGRTQNSAPSLG